MLAMLRPLEAASPRSFECRAAHGGIRARSIGQVVQAGQFAAAAERHQRYFLPGPGFEPHRGAGGNIETHAQNEGPVELHPPVYFEEIEKRADLNRPVARIARPPPDRAAASGEG